MRKQWLLYWNDTPFSQGLARFLRSQDIVVQQRNHGESEKVNATIVLAEIRSKGQELSRFYGLEILCKLRMEYRLTCPIVVCSFMPKEYLSKRFPILAGFSGDYHPFVQLPTTPNKIAAEIQNAELADEPVLDDIIRRYCHPAQRIGYLLTHGKGFKAILRGEVLPEACALDIALLRRYLLSNPFSAGQLTLANQFILNLEAGLRDGDGAGVLRTKQLLLGVLDSLSDQQRK
jgi:hypothetical protein